MSDFNTKHLKYRAHFDEYANNRFEGLASKDSTLLSPMRYSFFAGGKRIRPLLGFASNETVGGSEDRLLPFLFALECIHTYSLIHDDLPSMDNDDFRRGKPTNHKVYGEAMAILAGDALLNYAFSVALEECVKYPDEKTCRCAKLLADYAGFEGMIGGQASDILSEKHGVNDEKTLYFIEENKTGKLICAPVMMPYILEGRDTALVEKIGMLLGTQFQIVDDILDVESTTETMGKTVGKDAACGKLTFVSLFGLKAAKERSREIYTECSALIDSLPNGEFLKGFCELLYKRIS